MNNPNRVNFISMTQKDLPAEIGLMIAEYLDNKSFSKLAVVNRSFWGLFFKKAKQLAHASNWYDSFTDKVAADILKKHNDINLSIARYNKFSFRKQPLTYITVAIFLLITALIERDCKNYRPPKSTDIFLISIPFSHMLLLVELAVAFYFEMCNETREDDRKRNELILRLCQKNIFQDYLNINEVNIHTQYRYAPLSEQLEIINNLKNWLRNQKGGFLDHFGEFINPIKGINIVSEEAPVILPIRNYHKKSYFDILPQFNESQSDSQDSLVKLKKHGYFHESKAVSSNVSKLPIYSGLHLFKQSKSKGVATQDDSINNNQADSYSLNRLGFFNNVTTSYIHDLEKGYKKISEDEFTKVMDKGLR